MSSVHVSPSAARGLLVRCVLVSVVVVAACSHAPATATAPTPVSQAAKVSMPEGVTPDMVEAGALIFNTKSCKNCHLTNGVGGPRAPDLTDDRWIHIDGSYAAIVRLVTTGFTKAEQVDTRYQFSMNPRGGTNLTDSEIRAVSAYVWSLSHGGGK